MKKNLFLALVFIILPVLLQGCCEDIHRYSAVPGNLAVTVYDDTDLTEQDTLAFEDFTLVLDFPDAEVNLLSALKPLSFGAAAYATSCEDVTVFEPRITQVTVVSNRDYTSTYPAGANLAPIFKSKHYLKKIDTGEVSVDSSTSGDLVQVIENILLSKVHHISGEEYYTHYNAIKPTVAPAQPGTYVFTVSVTFGDGTVVSTQTIPVTFE